ncbi:hypothetical protein [Pediococcus argentinicus]|uniref:Lipoprotein n=1 Tax=Pediococcus argentinicus TaxID=480391 RepID=A0A0R2NK17_9LACO|nr:hypothetical protein [Pediococcus argentinicus]KRO24672.1 hypothetical protein IV88_GL000802 [Pediococcus argentinicus]NKZ22791.1 hypothetical protein [Pediococcus argentinicus]GEP19836.1 hypothetical protein LSA03_12200 [Pediococcus argentinicus]
MKKNILILPTVLILLTALSACSHPNKTSQKSSTSSSKVVAKPKEVKKSITAETDTLTKDSYSLQDLVNSKQHLTWYLARKSGEVTGVLETQNGTGRMYTANDDISTTAGRTGDAIETLDDMAPETDNSNIAAAKDYEKNLWNDTKDSAVEHLKMDINSDDEESKEYKTDSEQEKKVDGYTYTAAPFKKIVFGRDTSDDRSKLKLTVPSTNWSLSDSHTAQFTTTDINLTKTAPLLKKDNIAYLGFEYADSEMSGGNMYLYLRMEQSKKMPTLTLK